MTRWLIVLAGCVGLLAALAASPLLDRVEQSSLDARFAVRGTQPVHGLAVVAIDEATFSELNTRWPFRRTLHAQMLDRLHAAGARQVVYDVQFTEPSDREADDLALYDAVARTGHVILATGESDGHGGTRVLGGNEQLAKAGGAVAAASTFPYEQGGIIRRYRRTDAGLATIPAVTARLLGHPVPAGRFDDDGAALIDFRGGPGTIPTYSFADVLRGRIGAQQLRGKTVVVGATAPALQDVHPVSAPGERMMAGPEIQANAIWTALAGNPLQPVSDVVRLLLVLALAALGPLAVLALGPVRGVFAGVLAGAVYAVLAQLAFDGGTALPVALPVIALACSLSASALASAAAEIAARVRVTRYNAELELAVLERTAELADTQLDLVHRLARAAELRDDDTGDHIERVSGLCREVALQLGLSPIAAEQLGHASVLHDVGKIGVPDEILHKPGRLTDEEMAVMRRHVAEGALLLADSDSGLLRTAEIVARTHHERWDGSGYPNRIAGEAIPLEGRIVAVCDVFDALLHERPYKAAWTLADTRAEIVACSGRLFDPQVVTALLAVLDERERRGGRSPVPATPGS
jgi:CHASE2 domain-containing sensor protein